MNENDSSRPGAEAAEERVLRENLQVHALSPEALERIRRAAEAEWRANVIPTAHRRWVSWAAAASLMLIAVAGAWSFWLGGTSRSTGEPLGQLARADAPGVVELLSLWRETPVNVGSQLVAGQDLAVRGGTLLSLRGGGNLRIAPASEFEVISPQAVRLVRGEMYVDIPPGTDRRKNFVAITNAGEFQHVGTQFAVSVIDGATRLRVREGSVLWHAAEGQSTVEAGTEVMIDRDHKVTRQAIDTSGAHWSWIEAMAPEIDIENRPLAEFLDWVSRETGRKLIVADDHTRQQIAAIRMHGNVHGLEPMQALSAVMASTTLRFDLPAGAIRVSFAGESSTRQ